MTRKIAHTPEPSADPARAAALPSTDPSFPWFKNRLWLAILAIFLLTAVTYSQAVRNGYIWDDDAYIINNSNLLHVSGLKTIWTVPRASPQYYPIVFTSFWLEYRLWGLDPLGYHVVNVLGHATSAALVFLLLKRLKIPGGVRAAWLAGVLFAIHPVHVESVAWITERKNVLSALFYLLAMLAAVRVWNLDQNERPTRFAWRAWIACLVFFALALLSKSVTASLPAAILLLVWWRRGRIHWLEILYTLPLFAMGIATGLHTAYLEREHVGAFGPAWDLSGIERCLVAGRAAWMYFSNLAWPNQLVFFYERWKVDPSAWWQYLYPVGGLVVVAVLWFERRRIGRGPLVAVLFFLGTLFPALGFFNVYPFRYSYVADHFQYLASLGILVLAACLIVRLADVASTWKAGKYHSFARALPLPLTLLLVLISWRESFKYASQETLWTDTLEKNPASSIAYNNLGIIRQRLGNIEGAHEYYKKAVEMDPGSYEAMGNMGGIAFKYGRYAEAEQWYRRGLLLNPNHLNTLLGLCEVLLQQQRADEAVKVGLHACFSAPASPRAYFMLALALTQQGDLESACESYESAIKLDPDQPQAHLGLGRLRCALDDPEHGIPHIERALQLVPGWKQAEKSLASARDLLRKKQSTRPATK